MTPPPGGSVYRRLRLRLVRQVLLEWWQTLLAVGPIVVGVLSVVAVAALALSAWLTLPLLAAPTLPSGTATLIWLGQTLLASLPVWALRRRVWPAGWAAWVRSWPLSSSVRWRAELVVSALLLAPLAALYGLSAAVWIWQRPAWLVAVAPQSAALLISSMLGSWLLGGGWLMRWGDRGSASARRQRRAPVAGGRERSGPVLARASRLGPLAGWLWLPWWRGQRAGVGAVQLCGVLLAGLVSLAWCYGLAGREGVGFELWPPLAWLALVPGAAWAGLWSGLLLALVHHADHHQQRHQRALAPWLQALPVPAAHWVRAGRRYSLAGGRLALLMWLALLLTSFRWGWTQQAGLTLRPGVLGLFVALAVLGPLQLVRWPLEARAARAAWTLLCWSLLLALGSELWN